MGVVRFWRRLTVTKWCKVWLPDGQIQYKSYFEGRKCNARRTLRWGRPEGRSDICRGPRKTLGRPTCELIIMLLLFGKSSRYERSRLVYRFVPFEFSRDMETFIHLLKGSLGSGILAMPLAFMNAGLIFGLVATALIGFVCTYCVHILVRFATIIFDTCLFHGRRRRVSKRLKKKKFNSRCTTTNLKSAKKNW